MKKNDQQRTVLMFKQILQTGSIKIGGELLREHEC